MKKEPLRFPHSIPPEMERDLAIRQSVSLVMGRIAVACHRSHRDPDDVTLIAVTKTREVDEIAAAYAAGLRDFGENRVQEAAPKIAAARARGIHARWHMIGHLQSNKAKAAIDAFDILHSVDSERLAHVISERAMRPIDVLIEVNVGGEASKSGVTPESVSKLAERIGGLANIVVRGLMTVAPQVDDPEDVRPVFRRLRELRDSIGLRELSMGMTDDFEVAIEEGSTQVRVGRALFGPRMAEGDNA